MKTSTKKAIIRKLAAATTAGMLGIAATLPIMPAPAAEASILGNVLGASINAAAAHAEAKACVQHYNDTEEGRQELLEQLKNKYGVNEDESLNARLDSIMASLSAGIAAVDPSINDKPYLYFVNNDQSFNAFCTLGHDMSVNSGLFNIITNDDEIAVVLGHEMGHGQKDHPAKGLMHDIDRQAAANILVSASGSTAIAGTVGSLALNQSVSQATKSQEWEADNLSFDYLTHTDRNPGASAAVWQRVIDKYGNNSQDSVASFFNPSDHPNNAARRDNYEKKLKDYSGGHVESKNGKVTVNGKDFVAPAAAGDMSGAERSYFVQGNLAAAYHNGHGQDSAYAADGTVYLGAQAIMTPASGDESADVLAERLNKIK